MSQTIIRVPDLGGVDEAQVIEILVHVGDVIDSQSSILVVESEKASMEIPASAGGVVEKILVQVGDKVRKDTEVIVLSEASTSAVSTESTIKTELPVNALESSNKINEQEKKLYIPDLGGVEEARVIDVLVKSGDTIKKDDTVVVLESDKASMEIPAAQGGVVQEMLLAVGDKVSTGSNLLVLKSETLSEGLAPAALLNKDTSSVTVSPSETQQVNTPKKAHVPSLNKSSLTASPVHAGPAVRKLAREFGIDLFLVKPTGPRQRVLKEDLQTYVKTLVSKKPSGSVISVAPLPDVDFSEFGPVSVAPLVGVRNVAAINMHRNWLRIPHVTHFDEVDITELEAFRKQKSSSENIKITLLPFLMKAVVFALKEFPQFNTSLDAAAENLTYKEYYNVGFAVDTAEGLFVPVSKNVDQKTVVELAKEIKNLSEKAKQKKLMPAEMKGGCFTISSLGSIGGTAFTPIINAPEVAILGVSRAALKPVVLASTIQPRLILPLSLSYDHRVIHGAEAARFTRFLADKLAAFAEWVV